MRSESSPGEPRVSTKVTVYRFCRTTEGREISPRHMMGTLEAIALLKDCKPLSTSARIVDVKLLESGFFFEATNSIFTHIDEPAAAIAGDD
jgi:hypothetical protein